jgi:transposase
MKPISEAKRLSAIVLIRKGLSSRQIMSKLKIGRATINRLRKGLSPAAQKPLPGRPKKLNSSARRRLVRLILTGKADNAVQLAREVKTSMRMDVSAETVRRALKEAGMKPITKKKKPRLLPRHKAQRLHFAEQYRNWTVADWSRVIWSDETKINRWGSDGRVWCWKKPGSQLQDQHVQGTIKHGGGSLMMWGCMTTKGVGFACRIIGRMTGQSYVNILGNEFLPTLDYFRWRKEDIIFQQDNDPKHKSKVAQEWFEDNEVEVLQWPAQSPDLNPIEHLWQHLKRRLSSYELVPNGVEELWQRVRTEWDQIPPEVCQNLIHSMPDRVAAVLKAKGGYTNY